MAHHPVTAVYLTENIPERLELSLDSLRRLGGVEDLRIVVVNLSETDGMAEWADGQDVTYVFMEDSSVTWGDALNRVHSALWDAPPFAGSDLLVILAPVLFLPESAARLRQVLEENPDCGAAGGRITGGIEAQNLFDAADTLDNACLRASRTDLNTVQRVHCLNEQVILFRETALERAGLFDSSFHNSYAWAVDSCFSMLQSGYDLLVHENALFLNPYLDEEGRKKKLWEDGTVGVRELERKWDSAYFYFHENQTLTAGIRHSAADRFRVMEIGCCFGRNLLSISRKWPGTQCFGMELNEKMAKVGSRYFPIAAGNVETDPIPFEKGSFDYILLPDVLEHLRDPGQTLRTLRDYLTEDGRILAIIPNLMHISVMRQILNGQFTYTDTGLLDRTHIHLFTFYEIQRMFLECGYEITEVSRTGMEIAAEDQELIDGLLRLGKDARQFMYETFEYVVEAKKTREPGRQAAG